MQILEARFLSEARAIGQLPAPVLVELAFAGRSNVGKSSLINSLVARKKLVRTSQTPGCTRGINIFRVKFRHDESDAELDLVDLPGYGYAKRSKTERKAWGGLIERFLAERPGLRAVVVIVDVRRGLQDDDIQLLEFLEHLGQRAIVVATKVDKLSGNKRKPEVAKIQKMANVRVVAYSAVTGDGRDALWKVLLRHASMADVADATDADVTTSREG